MSLLLVACVAQAQEVPSLADHPDHDAYVRATGTLDLPFTLPPRNYEQMMPGTMGIVVVDSIPRGFVMATKYLGSDHQYLESLVYQSVTVAESVNTAGFSILYAGQLAQATEAGMDAQLSLLDQQDAADVYVGAADAYGGADGAKFLVSNTFVPNAAALANPDLVAITPLSSDCLDLYGFELVQNGAIVGWLLRERRDYGGLDVEWIDRWFYRTTFKPVSAANPTLLVRPPTTLFDADGSWTLPEFVTEILADAPIGTLTGLNRQQVSNYAFDGLDDLVP